MSHECPLLTCVILFQAVVGEPSAFKLLSSAWRRLHSNETDNVASAGNASTHMHSAVLSALIDLN